MPVWALSPNQLITIFDIDIVFDIVFAFDSHLKSLRVSLSFSNI